MWTIVLSTIDIETMYVDFEELFELSFGPFDQPVKECSRNE